MRRRAQADTIAAMAKHDTPGVGPSLAEEGLGGRFWLVLIGGTIVAVLGFFLIIFLFGAAWYAWGFVGAAIALIGASAAVQWVMDRRARKRWS
jgi:Kef-type K+ transport system membrane component KefB